MYIFPSLSGLAKKASHLNLYILKSCVQHSREQQSHNLTFPPELLILLELGIKCGDNDNGNKRNRQVLKGCREAKTRACIIRD